MIIASPGSICTMRIVTMKAQRARKRNLVTAIAASSASMSASTTVDTVTIRLLRSASRNGNWLSSNRTRR